LTSTIENRWELRHRWLPFTIASVGVALAVSLFYTPLPFVLLLGLILSAFFISRPFELLLFMVFLIPFNFVVAIGPVPVAAELLKVFAWIPFLIYLADRGLSFKTSRYNKWFAILGGILVLSIIRSQDIGNTLKDTIRFGSSLALCYLALNLVDSREKMMQVFRVLAVSTFIVACYGFYQWAIQDYGWLFWLVNPRFTASAAPGREVFWQWRGRIISVLTSEMELGHYFNLCLPIGVLLSITAGRVRLTSKWLIMSAAMFIGLLLTFTFASWIALAATAVFFLFYLETKRRWRIIVIGFVVTLVAGGLVLFGPLRPYFEAKALGMGIGGLAYDVMGRLDSWVFALQVWWAHPILGVGVGNFEALEYAHEYVHSAWVPTGSTPQEVYLYFLAMTGVVGLVSMLAITVGTIRENLRLRNDLRFGAIALALAFALTTAMLACFADDSPILGPHAGYLFWLLIGLSESVRRLAADRFAFSAQPVGSLQ
jgi:O-antigen ligase